MAACSKPETVAMAEKNHLGEKKIGMLPGVIPSLSNDAEFFPGLSKSWSFTFMVNDEEAPTGRPAGALGWAGLANLFYWIDRKNGFGGFWATQILPFGDPVVLHRLHRSRVRLLQLAPRLQGCLSRTASSASVVAGRSGGPLPCRDHVTASRAETRQGAFHLPLHPP